MAPGMETYDRSEAFLFINQFLDQPARDIYARSRAIIGNNSVTAAHPASQRTFSPRLSRLEVRALAAHRGSLYLDGAGSAAVSSLSRGETQFPRPRQNGEGARTLCLLPLHKTKFHSRPRPSCAR